MKETNLVGIRGRRANSKLLKQDGMDGRIPTGYGGTKCNVDALIRGLKHWRLNDAALMETE